HVPVALHLSFSPAPHFSSSLSFSFSSIPPPPSSTLFPYTTLFRSPRCRARCRPAARFRKRPACRFASSRHRHLGARCGEVDLSRSEEHTSELQSRVDLVCRLLLEKKKTEANMQSTAGNATRRASSA